ncbi:hypothetical protein GALMADRAFT_254175 [Galerina marginata CBS 339.88]|uniref:Carboxylic ester hydrolase n=1 Tax=Galerina marginata (strain CBS 339.88) TaxID=685588 RepID=A0A067SJG9_GALM3|nr:hypothetical protein GALMADRAFT_254175 [Galerina marginata CBS 339.88]
MVLTLVFFSLLAYANAVPVVSIGESTIIGSEFRPSKVEFFGGIPFAKPPVGELRLQPPVFVKTPPVKILHADKFGFACLQNGMPPDTVSEDCLTLNIFRPAGVVAGARLPVMVWIYGGGFVSGASSLYNGTEIVARSNKRGTPLIFASLNYRVGPLGFPQGVEAGQRNISNLGLQDQLAALEWIQNNIEKFGGDKSKVTLVGESAGAISINIHLMGTNIRKFARAAILESTAWLPTFKPEVNEAAWQSYVAAIPACASKTADTFDCIRSADSQALLQALTAAQIFSDNTFFHPVIDGLGGLLVDRPSKVVLKAHLPTMIGSTLDEGTFSTPQGINSSSQIEQFLIFGTSPPLVNPTEQANAVKHILELYPDVPALGAPFGTGNETFGLSSQYKRFAAIFGDFIFESARRTFAENLAAAGVKVFAYRFSDPDATHPVLPTGPAVPGSLGITHSSEISYVFGSPLNPTPTAVKLSKHMMDYWISFATSLDPNDNHLNETRPHWQQYTPREKMILDLNGHGTVPIRDNFRAKQIAFFQNNPDSLHR